MIGYTRLGSNGRLGNQMFQYAALRGIAANHGYEWEIPSPEGQHQTNYGLFDCFKMSGVKKNNIGFVPSHFPYIKAKTGSFDKELFNNCSDNCNLDDYFQTEKYFIHIENEIRQDFKFKKEYLQSSQKFIESVGDVIFLHIRRGDYVNLQHYHPLCDIEYYEKALDHFDKDIPVLVFSDDIEWCSQQKLFSPDRFLFSENNERYPHVHVDADGQVRHSLIPYTDLCLMSLCSGGIIANSSFSWWGAWLIENPKQPIIAPQKWYGTAATVNDSDLIPKRWKRI
jgi:hypothetical protein